MRLFSAGLIALLAVPVPAAGQAPQTERRGTVRIGIRDSTDLPVVGAHVTLTDSDGSTQSTTSNGRGEAAFDAIVPRAYTGRVESAGFSPLTIEWFTLRPGERVRRDVTLQVAGLVEAIDVAPSSDDQRLLEAFARQLTPDEIAALPEDPEELALVLRQMVGSDADIRVDGFSGGRLPPGTQIQKVRIRYDIGAASAGGGPRVDIQTTPGGDRWRNNGGMSVRDAALNARDAFSGKRPSGQARLYSWNVNAPLVRDRTGLSVSVDGSRSIDNQTIHAATPRGTYSDLLEQPSDRIGVWTRIEHRLSPAQTIRAEVGRGVSEARNQGIGQFDLPERAFTRKGSDGEFRLGHHATVRGVIHDLRFALGWESSDAFSVSDARTIRVLDAFTSGGAQQRGGQRSRALELENELQFSIRQVHQMTSGVSVERSVYRGDATTNESGTYIFSSLSAYEASQPTTFTERVGDAGYSYSMSRFGWHIQDDYRVRRNVVLNLGLRHDFQTHLQDWVNLAPRFGVSWIPSSKARTTLRASAGVFYVPLDAGTYRPTLLVNGQQQRDVVISDPGYPDPFSAGVTETAAPPSIIRARADLEMPFTRRLSFGVDQPIARFVRFRGTFARQTGGHGFRSRNANAPVDGVRPDPSVLNITELETTARSASESLQTELSINYPPRRLSAGVSYLLARVMDETDSAFSLPPDSPDRRSEWGPALGDVRHRVNAGFNSDLPGKFRVGAAFRAQSAPPYNITSGTDGNGDGVYSERPAGVRRNSGRAAGTKSLDVTLTWTLSLGQRRPLDLSDGKSRLGSGDGRGSPLAARDNALFRFEMFARATNVLNFANLQNFGGVATSPFYGLPTSAGPARRVVLGTRVWF